MVRMELMGQQGPCEDINFWGSSAHVKIFSQRMNDSLTESVNNKGVCRTAPATPGLLNRKENSIRLNKYETQEAATIVIIILKGNEISFVFEWINI